MKTKLILLPLLCAALASAAAQPFLTVSNPAPVIGLAWNPSPTPGVTAYNLYYGVASQQYTNKTQMANMTNTSVTLPARGVQFFFAVTAVANGLESPFSNEVNYSAPTVPVAPSMRPLVVLTVQRAPTAQGVFADTSMTYTDDPNQPEATYRLKIDRGFALNIVPPPMPGAIKK